MEENEKKEEEKNKKDIKPDLSRLEPCCTWECSTDGGTC